MNSSVSVTRRKNIVPTPKIVRRILVMSPPEVAGSGAAPMVLTVSSDHVTARQ